MKRKLKTSIAADLRDRFFVVDDFKSRVGLLDTELRLHLREIINTGAGAYGNEASNTARELIANDLNAIKAELKAIASDSDLGRVAGAASRSPDDESPQAHPANVPLGCESSSQAGSKRQAKPSSSRRRRKSKPSLLT